MVEFNIKICHIVVHDFIIINRYMNQEELINVYTLLSGFIVDEISTQLIVLRVVHECIIIKQVYIFLKKIIELKLFSATLV